MKKGKESVSVEHRIDEINMIKGIGIMMVVAIHLLSISGLKQFCVIGIEIEMPLWPEEGFCSCSW